VQWRLLPLQALRENVLLKFSQAGGDSLVEIMILTALTIEIIYLLGCYAM
jgi:hypothetical protein